MAKIICKNCKEKECYPVHTEHEGEFRETVEGVEVKGVEAYYGRFFG